MPMLVLGMAALVWIIVHAQQQRRASLLGAWLITRLPRRESLAAASCAVLVVPMHGLGLRSFDYTIQRVHQLLPRPVQVQPGPAGEAP
jgi:hypothetical protein